MTAASHERRSQAAQGPVQRPAPAAAPGLARGDASACREFVEAHYRGIRRFFLWLTNDAESAADLTQETFAAFWSGIREGAVGPEWGEEQLRAWLYGIARNRWRKRCRDARRWSGLEGEVEREDPAPGPEETALLTDDARRAAAAVKELAPDFREALVLRVWEELSYAQIAVAVGISEELARWRVHRARSLLRKALQQGGERAGG